MAISSSGIQREGSPVTRKLNQALPRTWRLKKTRLPTTNMGQARSGWPRVSQEPITRKTAATVRKIANERGLPGSETYWMFSEVVRVFAGTHQKAAVAAATTARGAR